MKFVTCERNSLMQIIYTIKNLPKKLNAHLHALSQGEERIGGLIFHLTAPGWTLEKPYRCLNPQ